MERSQGRHELGGAASAADGIPAALQPPTTPKPPPPHEGPPAITGCAQANGRNAISWEDKFKLDVWYVDHCSLWLDIKILWLTVKKVLVREGISAAGEATMGKFTGSKS